LAIVWEPVWEVVVIEHEGMRIRVLKDRETGLLACPICMHEMRSKRKSKFEDVGRFFFDVPSLINHLATHAL